MMGLVQSGVVKLKCKSSETESRNPLFSIHGLPESSVSKLYYHRIFDESSIYHVAKGKDYFNEDFRMVTMIGQNLCSSIQYP